MTTTHHSLTAYFRNPSLSLETSANVQKGWSRWFEERGHIVVASASCNHNVRPTPTNALHNHTDVLIAFGHKGKGGKYSRGPDAMATTTRK